jgi:hypothetical protein
MSRPKRALAFLTHCAIDLGKRRAAQVNEVASSSAKVASCGNKLIKLKYIRKRRARIGDDLFAEITVKNNSEQ